MVRRCRVVRRDPGALPARVPAELNRVVGLVGDAAAVEKRLREYVDAGADTVVVVPSATDDDPAGEHTLRTVAAIADDRDGSGPGAWSRLR